MEHKLITGGEQYLPFARSRIKALRATGLLYASQKFEIDGAFVKVRIEPGQDYIELSGGSTEMKMDSGMLGITGGIGEKSIWRYDPGYLIDCGPAVTYHAAFAKQASTPWVRLNASKDENAQLAGDIQIGSSAIKGAIYEDQDMSAQPRMAGHIAAASLSPSWQLVPGSSPAAQAVSTTDDVLVGKKGAAIFCPASIFTGRCRLYIQAVYGLPLYEYANKYKPGGLRGKATENRVIVKIVSETSAAPLLLIQSYVAADDFKLDADGAPTSELNEYPPVAVDTNCGVMLDTLGNHWLIQLNNGNIKVFPLISDKAGESMRKYSRARKDGAFRLSEAAREHLETYVLSRCLPDTKNAKMLATKYTCGGYSMGYGWHWNWSEENALTADIVVTETVAELAGSPYSAKMRSAHFRLQIQIKHKPVPLNGWEKTQKDRQTFNVTYLNIEDWKEWNVLRAFWCITEPNFATFTLSKTTPKLSQLFNCDAPFYAFYKRNELNVCRVKVTAKAVIKGTREATKGYCKGNLPGVDDITGDTLGPHNGYVKDTNDSSSFFDGVFSVGTDKTPALTLGRHHSGFTKETKDKVRYAERPNIFGADPYASSLMLEVGDPDDLGNYNRVGPFSGYLSRGYFFGWKWTNASYTTFEEYTSQVNIVVPFNDAECVYMQSQTQLTKASAPHYQFVSTLPTNVFITWTARSYIDTTGGGTIIGPFDKNNYVPSSPTSDAISEQVNPVPVITREIVSKIYCKAGALSCTWSSNAEFFNNELDDVGEQFFTLSGASVVSPTIFSRAREVYNGISVDTTKDFPITTVGWV